MPDDDDSDRPERGSSPVCYLDETSPAYAGYLTDDEVTVVFDALRTVESEITTLERELPRFGDPADSKAARTRLDERRRAVCEILRAALPKIASDRLHAALNRALTHHQARLAERPSAPVPD